MGIKGSGDVENSTGMAGVIAPDYVIVLELLEQADFANCCARDTFIFCFQPDLLEGNDLVRGYVSGLVHDTVSSWENDGDYRMSGGQDCRLGIPSPVGWDMGK